MKEMKSHYRVVVIGGGVVGVSVLYHLAKYGWSDVCVLERSVLAAGSSWHAAGGFHALNANPNMASLQAYTIDLLRDIQQESGQDIGLHMTGGLTVACNPDRWLSLQSAFRTFQSIGIDDCRLVTPKEAGELNPMMSTKGVIGGMWADREGYLDTTGTVRAYAAAARKRGASVFENTMVKSLEQTKDGWRVLTDRGVVTCEHVVNAAGLWAKQVGRMVGVELPMSPLKHHYLISESIPELEKLDFEMPMTMDLEGFTYLRQDQKGLLLGVYEVNYEHWAMDGAPWSFGMELFQEQPDRIEKELMLGYERFPALQTVGVKTWVNGAFTFSPDGNPLVGPVPGVRGYWTACGVMAGFLQGGGVGKTLAEWMIHGEPETDPWSMDVARYGRWAENRQYIKETTGQFYSRRFIMTYPNEQLPAGRPLKTSPAHADMSEAGARWGQSWDLEIPLYFAPSEQFSEKPTLKRPESFDIVGGEARHLRENVGIFDSTAISRFEISGPNATAWLNRILATKLPLPGRARLAVMLSNAGRLKGDFTLLNWGDGTWWLMGSYYLRRWHMRWFQDHIEEGVTVTDRGEELAGYAVVGPNSLKLMERLTDGPIAELAFMGCATLDIGLFRTQVARMSVTGEKGYEINCRMGDHAMLRRALLQAGQDLGVREVGLSCTSSLRLEKSYGIWSAEYSQSYTPAETGLDRWIDWEKGAFIGRDAAMKEKRSGGPVRRLVTLELDTDDADASGYEPVWRNGKGVGFITSGGFGHTLGKALAIALVDSSASDVGTALSVHVVGTEVSARVITPSPYDPEGRRMRA